MGQSLSQIVKDPRKGRELQRNYDIALALMIINLIVAFLPQTGVGWVPFFGGWIQFFFVIMSMTFSAVIYRMSSRFLPEYYGHGVNRAHLIIYILVVLLTIGGAISQSVSQMKYNQCVNSGREPYYNYGYGGYWNCYYLMYDMPSIILNNIIVPILSFVAMVLFSIQCSYMWNEAQNQARKLSGSLPMISMQTVSIATPTGQHQVVVPVSTFNAFTQWAAANATAAATNSHPTLPAYSAPVMNLYAVPPNVPVASSSTGADSDAPQKR
jgi:hypothetical protein